MSIARKIARADHLRKSQRKRLIKALRGARLDAARAAWFEDATAAQIVADCSEVNDLEGFDVNTLRKFAGAAALGLVVLYALAGVLSGC